MLNILLELGYVLPEGIFEFNVKISNKYVLQF